MVTIHLVWDVSICRIFEFNLLARHVPSGETFVVGLPPTPSIHELLDGIRSIVEREYGYHNFPLIPELFYTHGSQLPAPLPTTIGDPLSSSSTPPLNEATVSEDASPTPDLPQSLVKPNQTKPGVRAVQCTLYKLICFINRLSLSSAAYQGIEIVAALHTRYLIRFSLAKECEMRYLVINSRHIGG